MSKFLSEDGCYYFYFSPENESDIGKYVVEAKAADHSKIVIFLSKRAEWSDDKD